MGTKKKRKRKSSYEITMAAEGEETLAYKDTTEEQPSRQMDEERPPSDNPPPREDDEIKAFIGGLAWSVSNDELREHFEKFGVVSAMVSRDKFTDRSRGFGFVVFETEAGREDAIAEWDKKEAFGREIT